MQSTSTAVNWDVGAQLKVLLRRWKTVFAVVVLVVGAALGASIMQEPVYEGTVEVLLQRPQSEAILELGEADSSDRARRVETEIEVMKSEPVRAEVRRRLGPVPKVEVSQVGTSDVIAVSARSTNRGRAASVAAAYADAYIGYRRAQAVLDLQQAARRVEARIDDLQRQLDTLRVTQVGATASRDQLVTELTLYRQRLGDLRVDAELRSGGAQLVTQGRAPTVKVAPTPLHTGVLAAMIGLILGVGLAWLLEYLDESVKGKEDIERVVGGLPTLALIPMIDSWKNRSRALLVSLDAAGSPSAEAYRSLRTSLQFIGVERAPRVVQVTSPNAGEGKTSTLCNLAVAVARAGKRVVIVDCDLRRARAHEFFGLLNAVGFSSVFVGDAPIEEAVQQVPAVAGLALLPSGPPPPNQSELLASERTAEIFLALQNAYDMVLVDCPPVLPVTDATVLSAWVDAVMLVVVPGTTTRRELQRTGELLRQVGAPLIGVVINQTTRRSGYPAKDYEYKAAGDHGRRTDPGHSARIRRDRPAAVSAPNSERAGISDS